MLSANQKKYVNALKQKKYRKQYNAFVVEGVKMVRELLQSDYEVVSIFAVNSWSENNPEIPCTEITAKELGQISSLKEPNEVLAVAKQKELTTDGELSDQLIIALDNIQDPGNLGTIIRTADWFGIKTIVCSTNSVDLFNTKVIQATMGSFFRVNVVYTDLMSFFSENDDLTVYGALLEGENIYRKELKTKGTVLLMGNESRGISQNLLPFVSEKITIPNFGHAESLNISTATAIICSECKRV